MNRISSDKVPKENLIVATKKEKKFRMTSETMSGFCFVTSVICLTIPNNRKDDNDSDDLLEYRVHLYINADL
jgi:hypothetical protein